MYKLMRAYFTRLKRDKALWIFTVGMLFLSVVVMISGIRLNLKYPEEFSKLEQFTFRCAPYIGFFCAVIISMFLGTEYSDGTIRNKLVTGHTRTNIYLTSLTVSIAASELVALAWLLGSLVGLPHFGLWQLETEQLLLYLLLIVLSTAALGAIFNLIGLLVTNRTVSVVVAIFVSLGLIMLGRYLYNSLCEPETTLSGVVITADGIQFGDEIPNPAYVGGIARMVYFGILNILPPGQAILMANYDDVVVLSIPALEITGSVLILLVTSAVGLAVFRKKDLK